MRITRQIKTDIVKSISAIHDVCFTLLLPCHVILKLLPYVAVAFAFLRFSVKSGILFSVHLWYTYSKYAKGGIRMNDKTTENRRRFLLNTAFWVVILAIVYVVLKYLLKLVMPFFIALIVAAVSRPLARLLSSPTGKKKVNGETVTRPRRFHLPKNFAAILSVVVLYLLIFGLVILLCVRLVNGAIALFSTLPGWYNDVVLPGLETAAEQVMILAEKADEDLLEAAEASLPNIISTLGSGVTKVSVTAISWLSSFAGKVPGLLLNGIICLIATVFISVDFDRISAFIRRLLPARPLEVAEEVKDTLIDIVWQFIKSYFLIFIITLTEITIGLLIIGVKKPVAIAALIAVFDAFPIVGSGMILLPWAVFTMISGPLWKGIGLAILYAVVVIARQIIEPKIVGKHVGLRPLVTLICMFVGSKLFGVLGLFGLPITAAIIADMESRGVIHLFRNDPVPAGEEAE